MALTLRQLRDPNGVVHYALPWTETRDPNNQETWCESWDSREYWPGIVLRPTTDVPTCIKCIAIESS